MTKTRAELIEEALRELGALAAGQGAAPEDAQNIDAAVEPLMANLAARDIYVWGDPDQIDDEAFLFLARLLANEKARSFGAAYDEGVRRLNEKRLRELQRVILSGQPQRTEYF